MTGTTRIGPNWLRRRGNNSFPVILQNDFRRQWEDTKDAVLEAVTAVGQSGWYILGEQVKQFEAALAERWGMRYAVGVGCGMDAIEIGLRLLGCGTGDKVLTTPLSAFATTLAIAKTGAAPVFVDTDDRGLIDLAQSRSALEGHPDIRFMVPVHLYGHALDLRELGRLREKFDCRIVEDCAQSILATFAGAVTGSAGALCATSFYPTKNLGALGDGGAILSNREEDAMQARALRDYGQSRKYRHDWVGHNSRLDELQAAIMTRAYLPRLSAWTARRKQIAGNYLEGIRHPAIRVMDAPAGSDSVWHLFPVRVDAGQKAGFMAYLRAHDILCGEHYPFVIPDQKALRGVPHDEIEPCTRARAIAGSEVSLPIHPYLTDSEIGYIIEVCNRWMAEGR
jgi:dTDP-3-amino-3,4,6-trideoxy-alpha-D-glucose transaminase